MTEQREWEAVLRDGLAAEASRVTAEAGFSDRVIAAAARTDAAGSVAAAAYRGPDRPGPGWRNWVLPAAAAALVALLVGSVLLATSLLHSSGPSPANQPAPAPSASAPIPTSPTRQQAPPSSSAPSSPSRTVEPRQPVVGPVGGPVPAGFRAFDMTWVSDQDGWALGSAPCDSAPCTSIVRTQDGGQTWAGIPAPKAYLAQQQNCGPCDPAIQNLRFANSLVGYAYGFNSFYLTTDGGEHWQRQPGFAFALAVVGDSVLRVTAQAPGCAPGCTFVVQRAAIGSTAWHDISLPAPGRDVDVDLAASGNTVVLDTYGNPAGGVSARAVVFTSTDSGSTWHPVGEPCPQVLGTEVYTAAVTVASDQSISVLCQARGGSTGGFTMTSTDGGMHFSRGATLPASTLGAHLAAGSASDLLLAADRLYRSTDGGASWQQVGSEPDGGLWLGMESSTVGRLIDAQAQSGSGQARIWTTTDGGATWAASAVR